jgi:prophage regulatory protein
MKHQRTGGHIMKAVHPIDITLPNTGYLRLPDVLLVIPIGKSTWWDWVAIGKAPKPVKLSVRTSAWRVMDIRELIKKLDEESE